jgi:hypothetical protein
VLAGRHLLAVGFGGIQSMRRHAYAAVSTAAGRASAGLPFFFRPAAESRDENDVYLNVHKL